MKKIIHMVTLSRSIPLMNGQLEYLKDKGYTVGLVSSSGKELNNQEVDFKKSIKMERNIHLANDLKSLLSLIKYFKKERPDLVNVGTPKAGLLGIIASFITRVPNRVYTMRGLRLETTSGMKRNILWLTEKISCLLATKVICISPSLLDEARNLKLVGKKGIVLKKGSSNGINIDKYPLPEEEKVQKFIYNFKTKKNIRKEDYILGFVGRLTKDKGINELIEVFNDLNLIHTNIKLIILGSVEEELHNKIKDIIKSHKSIYYLGHVTNPYLYYYLFDLLIFPTHREGFGNVSIQAQAASIPVITTDATGARDTIINNKTGLIYPVGNKDYLKSSIMKFYDNKIDRKEYGANGRIFVKENFQSITIWNELGELYDSFFE